MFALGRMDSYFTYQFWETIFSTCKAYQDKIKLKYYTTIISFITHDHQCMQYFHLPRELVQFHQEKKCTFQPPTDIHYSVGKEDERVSDHMRLESLETYV